MSKFRLRTNVTVEVILNWIKEKPDRENVWAVHTCWWSLWEDDWLPYKDPSGLPCDPTRSVLMQGKLSKFWEEANKKPNHYGKHGLSALMAAFHSNLEYLTDKGVWLPSSFSSWDTYNLLIDAGGELEI